MNTIVFVVKGYPRLSETFIAQEIELLEQRGLTIHIFSLRLPTEQAVHPVHKRIKAKVSYLPEYALPQLLRVLRAYKSVRHMKGYKKAWRVWCNDFKRDRTINRMRRFAQAIVLAHELPESCVKMHAHFLHTPTSVTRYTSLITGIPFSISAHAKDIWTSPKWDMVEKIQDAEWLTTCTQSNTEYLKSICPDKQTRDKIFLDYHGIDVSLYRRTTDHTNITPKPITLISVGRAVTKKGYPYLLRALATIDATYDWRFIHIGDGPLMPSLKQTANELNIADRITFKGSQTQQQVIEALKQADIFVLLSIIDKNGDRDGLPNVIMEAQGFGLPVVTSNISGIPELITNEVNGLIVEPKETHQVAQAIQRLIDDEPFRRQLGKNGRDKITEIFDKEKSIEALFERHIN